MHANNSQPGHTRARFRRWLDLPELNVAVLAFLLNFVWEMWQIPFFLRMPQMAHQPAVLLCSRAAVGDAGIALLAFWAVAAIARSRRWILRPAARQVVAFLAVGLLITLAVERWSLAMGRWAYAPLMPVVPVVEIGLLPALQWLVLPPLVVWFVRRQLT